MTTARSLPLNIFHTAPATIVGALQDEIARHGCIRIAFDRDGNLHAGPSAGVTMTKFAENHPELVVTTYNRSITARDLLSDLAARLDELSTYGLDRMRRRL